MASNSNSHSQLLVAVNDQFALRVVGYGIADAHRAAIHLHGVLGATLAGQLGQICVMLAHMHAKIAALLGLVRAVGTLMRWFLAAALDILVTTQCRLPAIFLATMTTLVDGLAVQANAIGASGAAIAAAATIVAQCELELAESLCLSILHAIIVGEHVH